MYYPTQYYTRVNSFPYGQYGTPQSQSNIYCHIYLGNTYLAAQIVYLYLAWWFSEFNLLAPELFFLILAHPVYKMWIIQELNKLELWNKLHFEEKETEIIYHV